MIVVGDRSGRRTQARRAAAVSLIASLCIACSTSPAEKGAEASPAPPASTVAARVASPGLDLPTFDPTATPDPARVEQLMDDGLGEGQAVFGALTRVEVEQLSPLSYRITQAYPTGNTGEMIVTLTPDQTFDADAAGAFRATYAETDRNFTFRLEYYVAYDDIPDDVEHQIRGADARPDAVTLAADRATALGPVAADTSGVGVVVEGVVTEAQKAGVSAFVDYLDRALDTNAALDKFKGALEAGVSVKDAMAVRSEHDAQMKRIDALEECARNPTNPLVRREYQENPAAKQRILDAVADTRASVKANFAVIFLSMVNSTASGLTGGASKVLGFIVGPVTDAVKAHLLEDNRRRIAELERMITACEGFTIDFAGRSLANQLYGGTFDLVGELVACLEEDGTWRFEGTYTITNHADEISEEQTDHGWLLDIKGGQTPDAVEVVLGYAPTVEEHMAWGFPEGAGTVLLKDALGEPSAAATVYNHLDEVIGNYPLTVSAGPPECDP